MAVQLVVRIRGEALGSPTGMAISQRLSWRFTSIPLTLAKERPPRSSLRLADDEIRAKGGNTTTGGDLPFAPGSGNGTT